MYHLEFFAMLILAAVGTRLPLLGRPLTWLETYFHEISHGLACLLTFGVPVKLQLKFGGAGMCTSRGGLRFIILLAGYAGAAFWGMVIYFAGVFLSDGGAFILLGGLLALLILTLIVLVRDIQTLIITLFLIGLFYVPLQFSEMTFFTELLRFVGMAVALNAVKSPLYLIDGKKEGDGAMLAKMTFIPEGVWILLWFAWGLAAVMYMWQVPLPPESRILTFLPFI